MATHISAEKRARQSEKRRQRNLVVRTATKSTVKKALEGITKATSKEEAIKALILGEQALQKAVSKGVLPKERASRKTARLAHAVRKKFSKTSARATA